jgi:2-C-methyl-D-erythritol 4-phosphate cytidylyltransferase
MRTKNSNRSDTNVKTTAIIVAAGSGKRMGGPVRKQFMELDGKPILQHTLEKFQAAECVQEIILVVPQRDVKRLSVLAKSQWNISKIIRVVPGGRERHDSVWAGLSAVDPGVHIILIHDGVRPFVPPALIKKVITAAVKFGAAVVGVAPKETIKKCDATFVMETLQRQSLVVVQTPQAFRRDIVKAAYERAFADGFFSTDDAALVERMNHRVYIVDGDYSNLKITCPEDLAMAEAILKNRSA